MSFLFDENDDAHRMKLVKKGPFVICCVGRNLLFSSSQFFICIHPPPHGPRIFVPFSYPGLKNEGQHILCREKIIGTANMGKRWDGNRLKADKGP